MTLDEVQEKVEEIRNTPSSESAHYLEDELYRELLEEAAGGRGKFAVKAQNALKTQEFDHERWFA